MRSPLPFVIITALALAPVANAQTAPATRPAAPQTAATKQAVTQAAAAEPAVTQPAFAPPVASQRSARRGSVTASPGRVSAHSARSPHSRRAPPRRTASTGSAPPADKSGGVLDLGATDITGNKELPKVMVIVPWKDSLGAGGVIKPTDSLMDEMLQPVDRDVFQRRIRYYGQLEPTRVAPVGDSH